MAETPAAGTGDDAWDEFDSESYFQHYYGDPHPDDDVVVRMTCAALKAAEPAGPLDTIDVGTGANLYPLFAALPRAGALTAYEYSRSNVAWLRAELQKPDMRPQWRHYWNVVREGYGSGWSLPDDPVAELRTKATIRQGSIYELPERKWDAATMFFCAEAVTDQQAEFDRACACFARAVRPGGTLAAAFLLSSASYVIAGRRYPVMTLSAESLRDTFSRIADRVTIEPIGIVKEEVRSGYTGMAFVTARSR